MLQVTDPNGAGLCRESGTLACKLSGSAEYQLIVSANNYAGVAITTHLDTWLVGNASGWAPVRGAPNGTSRPNRHEPQLRRRADRGQRGHRPPG